MAEEIVSCCKEVRNLSKVELVCASCNSWYHEGCIGSCQGKYLPLMQNYHLQCQTCAASGVATVKKKAATFSQMCLTAMANLYVTYKDSGRTSFSVHKDVIPFIESHWEELTTVPKRTKTNWHSTVVKTMVRDSHIFRQVQKNQFELVDPNLSHIGPQYESSTSGGSKGGGAGLNGSVPGQGQGGEKGSRGVRRKGVDSQSSQPPGPGKRSRGDPGSVKQVSSQGLYPAEYLHNKDDFHYILAEPDPHAPYRREFDECPSFLVTPGFLFRPISSTQVSVSINDKAPQLQVQSDGLSVTGHKGYSTCRVSHCVSQGHWYYEARITSLPDNGAAARIGWGQIYANLQAPLGYDKFGYSWRSLKGTVFHESRGKHYMDDLSGYTLGDVIGFYIYLPPRHPAMLPTSYKDKALIKYKNFHYYEYKLNKVEKNRDQRRLRLSKIKFYKNGKSPGVAFQDLLVGDYFPSVSLYKDICVSLNFGPDFEYPPADVPFRPMSERLLEMCVEQAMSEMLYFIENEDEVYRTALTFIIPP